MQISHPIPPFIRPDSLVLILGSFPSVKSRETGFYYDHQKNRFWCLLSTLLKTGTPDSIQQKQCFLSIHRIALWDVVQSCEAAGSSDSSIRDVRINPINELLADYRLRAVFLNGKVAGRLFLANISLKPDMPVRILPSTSAANASCSLDKLAEEWKVILPCLK